MLSKTLNGPHLPWKTWFVQLPASPVWSRAAGFQVSNPRKDLVRLQKSVKVRKGVFDMQRSLIDIGSLKQLFLDDSLIEATRNVRPVLNAARKIASTPIIPGDKPWEGNTMNPKCIYYDSEAQEFRMWYATSNTISVPAEGETKGEENPAGDTRRAADERYSVIYGKGGQCMCYATSHDGSHWEKPDLGLVAYQGSTDNNIIPRENLICGLYGMFYDVHEADPAKRFKGMKRAQTYDPEVVERLFADPNACYYRMEDKYIDRLKAQDNWGSVYWNLYTSPDGFSWMPDEDNPVVQDAPQARTWAGPTNFMWDPIRQTYAVHTEATQHTRSTLFSRNIGRAESPDMKHWTYPELIILPDENDPPDTQLYTFSLTEYTGVYLGMLTIYRTNSGRIYPEFVCSRDGIRYHRHFRQPFIPLGARGDFDALEIYAQAPITVGDTHYIYYTGRIAGHRRGITYQHQWTPQDLYAGVGLATLPLDGFVSMDAADAEGELVTRSFTFTGRELHLNLSGGPLRVERLGPSRHLIPGYSLSEADPIFGTHTDVVATWSRRSDLSHLQGKPIKLRFQMQKTQLFSFHFD